MGCVLHNKQVCLNGRLATLYGYDFSRNKVIYRIAKNVNGIISAIYIEFPISYNPPT